MYFFSCEAMWVGEEGLLALHFNHLNALGAFASIIDQDQTAINVSDGISFLQNVQRDI